VGGRYASGCEQLIKACPESLEGLKPAKHGTRNFEPIRQARLKRSVQPSSATAGKNHRQLVWWNHFELVIGAVVRLFVRAPPAKLRCVAEAVALHVLVSDFHHQFGTQRLPRQVLALAPAALTTGHAMFGFTARRSMLSPILPRVSGQRILAVWSEEFYQLAALLFREARANSNMLQRAGVVKKAEQE